MMIETISDFRKAFRSGKWMWPGGYPCYFLLSDGESLSFEAAKTERRRLLEALADYQKHGYECSGWRPVAIDVNWEDGDMVCAHTGKRIESAYTD